MIDNKIVINGTTLNDIKKLLYTGQRAAITTSSFERIIELLEEKTQECKNLKKKLDIQTITASRRYSELNTAWNNRCKKYNNNLKQLACCQKTLDEIEKILDNGTADTQTNNAKWLQQHYLARFCEIRNIINKTKERE